MTNTKLDQLINILVDTAKEIYELGGDDRIDVLLERAKQKPGSNKVGYGKPPRKTRFKKGISGNPHGRPKEARPGTHKSGYKLGTRIAYVHQLIEKQPGMTRALVIKKTNEHFKENTSDAVGFALSSLRNKYKVIENRKGMYYPRG